MAQLWTLQTKQKILLKFQPNLNIFEVSSHPKVLAKFWQKSRPQAPKIKIFKK